MKNVFGMGTRGREAYGLRFASCDTVELLNYEGVELLMIASRTGEEGLEQSLGEGRGEGAYTKFASLRVLTCHV